MTAKASEYYLHSGPDDSEVVPVLPVLTEHSPSSYMDAFTMPYPTHGTCITLQIDRCAEIELCASTTTGSRADGQTGQVGTE